jgi:phenylpyruvate tautomerase PptA (4-oxalocrotonate tautomerase family)
VAGAGYPRRAVPLIEIQATGQPDRVRVSRAVAAAVAEALNARPDTAWIVWRQLAMDDVTIGPDNLAARPAEGVAIAHVYLTRTPEQVEAVADAVSGTLEVELGLDASRVLVCTHAFAL